MIRVVIVDDQEIAREGLKALLGSAADIEVAGEATDGAEVVERVRRLRPDLVLMDVRMRRVSGLQAVREIRRVWPTLAVVMLSVHADLAYVVESIRAGAVGYLLKDTPGAALVEAIRTTVAGGSLLTPVVLRHLLVEWAATMSLIGHATGATLADGETALTGREGEIVRLLREGLTNKQIARELGIGPSTVKTHLERIFAKLGVSGRTQAALWAAGVGLDRRPAGPDESDR